MEELADFIGSFVKIERHELDVILSHFNERAVLRDSLILREGRVASEYIFIKRGALRAFYKKEDKEVTGWVAMENEFFCDLPSLKSGTPSEMNIQALEDSIIMTIPADHMERLYDQFPVWQKFGRLLWEKAFSRVLEGVITFQSQTAEERYKNTMEQTELIRRVPLKHVSSYIGITPSSLSRLRKKK